MKRLIIVLLLLLSCSLVEGQINVNVTGWWGDGGAFNASDTPIQAAVTAANSYDTVYVWNGTYTENIDVPTAHLTLEGEGRDVVTVNAAVSSDNIFYVTANYVNISGVTTSGAIDNGAGICLVSADYCNISGNMVSNNQGGIVFLNSDYNNLTNNLIDSNIHYGVSFNAPCNNNNLIDNIINSNGNGIYFSSHPQHNILTNNTINFNNKHAIHLSSSNNNVLTNNRMLSNVNDIYADNSHTYSQNQILHTLHNKMLATTEMSRIKNINDVVDFSFSMFDIEGNICDNCGYNITTSPVENVMVNPPAGNTITGNFTITRDGVYSLIIQITDANDNIAKRRYSFLVGNTDSETIRYYMRDVDPTHGQPRNVGAHNDVKASVFSPPTVEEYWFCSAWVINSVDELPPTYRLANLDSIDIHSWYKGGAGYIGIQRFTNYTGDVDQSQPTSGSVDYIPSDNTFLNLDWIMDYRKSWYWLSVKLGGGDPYWKTNATHLAHADFTYSYSTNPAIKAISNEDILLLSATSPATDNTSTSIVLDGEGATNLLVQMPNFGIDYKVTYDGNPCNNAVCSFNQVDGELNFTLILDSEHTLNISEDIGYYDSDIFLRIINLLKSIPDILNPIPFILIIIGKILIYITIITFIISIIYKILPILTRYIK